MLYLYYGKVGDGKTYHVVKNELLPAVFSGRMVYTNIDGLNLRHIAMVANKHINELNIEFVESLRFRQLLYLEHDDREGHSLRIERNSLVIVDEAQVVWDARQFKDTEKTFLNFLEYHRHFGFDLVFITQNPKRLEASISRLCNEAYQVKNLRFLGAFLRNHYVVHIRQTPFDRDIVATLRGRFRDDIFLCYRSYVSFKFSKKSKGALRGFIYYATFVLFILSVAIIVIRGGFSFTNPNSLKGIASVSGSSVQNTSSNDNKGVIKYGDIKTRDFVYNSGSNKNALQNFEKKDFSYLDLCHVQTDYINYVRRGNTLLYKKGGVWYNKELNCVDDEEV